MNSCFLSTQIDRHTNTFLQRVSIACYAERCISYDRFRLTVRLTVRHSPVSCQNDSSYDHTVFTAGQIGLSRV